MIAEDLKQERVGLQAQPFLFILQRLLLEEENRGRCDRTVVREGRIPHEIWETCTGNRALQAIGHIYILFTYNEILRIFFFFSKGLTDMS